MLSVDGIFSNLRNRTNRLNLFQFCFVLLLVSIFNFISRNLLPCKKFAFSKLTVSRAGFTASCDDGEGGRGVGSSSPLITLKALMLQPRKLHRVIYSLLLTYGHNLIDAMSNFSSL